MSDDAPANRRPSIADVAAAAQVSIATVNRVLSGKQAVRRATAQQVAQAAEALGFYAARAMRGRAQAETPRRTFGFLMQQQGRSLYQMLGNELKAATLASAAVRGEADGRASGRSLARSPPAERLLELGRDVDAIAVVTVDRPWMARGRRASKSRSCSRRRCDSQTLTAQARAGYVEPRPAGRVGAAAELGDGEAVQEVRQDRRFRRRSSLSVPGHAARSASARIFEEPCHRLPGARCHHDLRGSPSTPTRARSTSCAAPPISFDCSSAGGGRVRACCRDFARTPVGWRRPSTSSASISTPEARSGLLGRVVDVMLSAPRSNCSRRRRWNCSRARPRGGEQRARPTAAPVRDLHACEAADRLRPRWLSLSSFRKDRLSRNCRVSAYVTRFGASVSFVIPPRSEGYPPPRRKVRSDGDACQRSPIHRAASEVA